MALALDGSVHGNSGSASSLAVSLTTANANDVIIVVTTVNGGPITGVTGAGLTFSLIKRQASTAGANAYIEYWRAIASSALTAVSITVTQTSSDFITVDAFGISGANTSSPEDANASTPAGATSSPLSVTTDTADCFIFGGRRLSTPDNTAGSGFTIILGANFQVAEYKIVSTTQTALSVGTGSGSANGAIADAIVIAGASSRTITGAQTLSAVTQSATLTAAIAIVGAQTMASIVQVATAYVARDMAAAQTLGTVSQVATAAVLSVIQAAQTLSEVSQAATISAAGGFVAAQTLDAMTQAATAAAVVSIVGGQTLSEVTQAAVAAAVLEMVAAQTLASVAQNATIAGDTPASTGEDWLVRNRRRRRP